MKATPTHYYEWGDELPGYVSTYYVDENGVVRLCKGMPKEKALSMGLKFDCPFP